MTAHLTHLRRAYESAAAYTHAHPTSDRDLSAFWSEILVQRRNYPTFDEMLVMRRGFTYPMAERRAFEDQAAEEQYARAAQIVARRSVGAGFLEDLEEPAFGAPLPLDIGGKQLTSNCLVNAVTVHAIVQELNDAGLRNRPLRVLEIGAGFGQAARMLLERLDVRTYAICDLPENLFLSSFYLQALFPERKTSFVDDQDDGAEAQLSFVVPALARNLKGPFDLVLNSYSFQEMNRASVVEYFSLAADTLSEDGVFYSLNSHAKDEIEWPSDYPVEQFHLTALSVPRKLPFQLMATVPYGLVLRRGSPQAGLPGILDGIASAFQLGLDDELIELCERVVSARVAPGELEWLGSLAALFRAPPAEKAAHAERLLASGLHEAASSYLAGCLSYTAEDFDEATRRLEGALDGLGPTLARAHADTMLASLSSSQLERRERLGRAADIAPHLEAQLAEAAANRVGYGQHIRACLRLPAQPPQAGRLPRGIRKMGSILRSKA